MQSGSVCETRQDNMELVRQRCQQSAVSDDEVPALRAEMAEEKLYAMGKILEENMKANSAALVELISSWPASERHLEGPREDFLKQMLMSSCEPVLKSMEHEPELAEALRLQATCITSEQIETMRDNLREGYESVDMNSEQSSEGYESVEDD